MKQTEKKGPPALALATIITSTTHSITNTLYRVRRSTHRPARSTSAPPPAPDCSDCTSLSDLPSPCYLIWYLISLHVAAAAAWRHSLPRNKGAIHSQRARCACAPGEPKGERKGKRERRGRRGKRGGGEREKKFCVYEILLPMQGLEPWTSRLRVCHSAN